MTAFLKANTRISSLVPARTADGSPKNVAARLVEAMAKVGISQVFGIPGRHVQELFHALPDVGIQPIVCRHEQGAVFMADGYARLSGQPAGVIATAGPGAANLLTGVANAFADGVPVLCVTGAPGRHFASKGAFQELGDDHTGVTPAIFQPVTRYNAQLSHPEQLAPTFRLAVSALESGGPVLLTVPSDLLETDAPAVAPALALARAEAAPQEAIEEAARLLEACPDALILAGRGALGATEALRTLAERLQIPVVTTVHGRGAFDEEHPLALGAQGFSASHWAERYLETHRPAVVLAVGTSLREISTNVYHEAFAGTDALIHCTHDAQAIGRHYPTALGVVAEASAFLQALAERVGERAPNTALAQFKQATPRFDHAALEPQAGYVSPRRVVESLQRSLGPDDVLLADTGNAVPWAVRYFSVSRPGQFFASLHLAAMGWGVAAAIGMQIAAPERRVVALVGDGCFQIAGMEIATAVQQGLPVVWVVLNDAKLNMVHQGSRGRYGAPIAATELSHVDCARVAEGLGAAGFSVTRPDELDQAIAAALACGRPAVVDVAIDPALMPPMAGRFEAMRRFEERHRS